MTLSPNAACASVLGPHRCISRLFGLNVLTTCDFLHDRDIVTFLRRVLREGSAPATMGAEAWIACRREHLSRLLLVLFVGDGIVAEVGFSMSSWRLRRLLHKLGPRGLRRRRDHNFGLLRRDRCREIFWRALRLALLQSLSEDNFHFLLVHLEVWLMRHLA